MKRFLCLCICVLLPALSFAQQFNISTDIRTKPDLQGRYRVGFNAGELVAVPFFGGPRLVVQQQPKTMAAVRADTNRAAGLVPTVITLLDAGKQGVFILDTLDKATADDGTTVLRTAGNFRYKRIANSSSPISSGTLTAPLNLSIGQITSVAANQPASASISGSFPNLSINLWLPRGQDGAAGSPGATGATGATGQTGAPGAPGQTPTLSVRNVTTGPAGSAPSITNVGSATAVVWDVVLPKGDAGSPGPTGATGQTGQTPTITVRNVITGPAGSAVSITNVGSATAVIWDVQIPRGQDGATGATGQTGQTGQTGAPGQTPTITVRNVTTGAPGSAVTITNVGSGTAVIWDVQIPRGQDGAAGSPGATGATGSPGATGATGATGQTGAPGAPGQTPTLSVRNVTTGPAGSAPSITNVGSATAVVWDVVLPKGDAGSPGVTSFTALTDQPLLGTAAAKNVAASGDATTTQVVTGNDTRLNNARTPTPHTHPFADVSGLDSYTSTLANTLVGKEATANKVTSLPGNTSTTQYPTAGAINAQFWASQTTTNAVLRQINTNQTAYDLSPLAGTWYDAAAFGILGLPTYETSNDFGATYTPAPVPKKLFQQKLDETAVTLTNATTAVTGIRLTYGSIFGASYLQWLRLTSRFPNANALNVTVEFSNDGSTWTTAHVSTAASTNGFTLAGEFYKLSLPPNGSYNRYRITITVNAAGSVSGSQTNLTGLKLLTLRTGDTGGAPEREVPYAWDENRNLLFNATATPVSYTAVRPLSATRQYVALFNGAGSLSKSIMPYSSVTGVNSAGDVQTIHRSSVGYPLKLDRNKQISLATIHRSAVAVNDTARHNLSMVLSYTGSTSASYGMGYRQVQADSLIRPSLVNGKQTIRFALYKSQSGTGSERSELSQPPIDTGRFEQPNRQRWMGTAVYVPRDFISDNASVQPIVFQWHDNNNYTTYPWKSGRVPVLAMSIQNQHWNFVVNRDSIGTATGNAGVVATPWDLGPVNVGQFTRWVVNTKWSTNGNDGWVKVWKNDTLVVNYTGANCYNDIGTGLIPYFKMGIYGWAYKTYATSTSPMQSIVIHHSGTRYADGSAGYADVAPDATYDSNNQFVDINIRSDSARVEQRLVLNGPLARDDGRLQLDPATPESATAVAFLLGTAQPFTTGGAKLLSLRAGGTELFAFGQKLGTQNTGTLSTLYMPGWSGINAGGRLDLTSAGDIYLTPGSAAKVWVQRNLAYTPQNNNVATSTATPVNPGVTTYGHNLWNGTAGVISYNAFKSLASTSVTGLTRFSFQFGGTTSDATDAVEQAYLTSTGGWFSKIQSGAGLPTAATLPAGYQVLWLNTTDNTLRWYVNLNGTITETTKGLIPVEVPTYAAMLALGTPAPGVLLKVKVATDEAKSNQTNTIYEIWPSGTRMWMAGTKDN